MVADEYPRRIAYFAPPQINHTPRNSVFRECADEASIISEGTPIREGAKYDNYRVVRKYVRFVMLKFGFSDWDQRVDYM